MFKLFQSLAQLRQAKGLSDEDMCKILQVNSVRLRDIEAGRATPPTSSIIAYANALEIDVEQFLKVMLQEYVQDFYDKAGISKNVILNVVDRKEGDTCHGKYTPKVPLLQYSRSRERSSPMLESQTIFD